MTVPFVFRAADETDTERLGQALAEVLPEGTVVSLDGPLGAGKTRLVQAISVALGVDRDLVVSPTFVLVHEYKGTRPIFHLDAYRLRDADEFDQLGAFEYFRPPNLVLIEWGMRVLPSLPEERLDITITAASGNHREFQFQAHGEKYEDALARLAPLLAVENG